MRRAVTRLIAGLTAASGGAGAQPAAPAAAGRLAPAPYVAPAPGTRYVYGGVAQTVTGNRGLRTTFTDGAGRPGARVGLFIADNPRSPLALDTVALDRLWPLYVGKTVRVTGARAPLKWAYDFKVVGTERVTVPAGAFDAYVVELTETAVVTRNPTAPPRVTVFWYAPAPAAVVRFSTGLLTPGPTPPPRVRQELVRIEPAR